MNEIPLRPCPCGVTPSRLTIQAEHDQPKWARACGNCCGEWSIEFRNQYHQLGGEKSYALAAEAWNEASRAQ